MSNEFWDQVNKTVALAEEVRLPKPHLTQPEAVVEVERLMGDLDEPQRAIVHRQVLTGVVEGVYSQYAALPFSHFAWGEGSNAEGAYRYNRAPEAKRLMAVIDAVIAEMPEDSEHRARNDAYAEAVNSIREENGKVDNDRLTQLILEADERDEPFWTDSREFFRDGEVEGSNLTLADLVVAGAITVLQAGGGAKVFVAKGNDLAQAVDNLKEAGFVAAAELLQERTQRRPRSTGNGGRRPTGKGLKGLAALGNDSEGEADDKPAYTTESDDNGPTTVGSSVDPEIAAALQASVATEEEATTA